MDYTPRRVTQKNVFRINCVMIPDWMVEVKFCLPSAPFPKKTQGVFKHSLGRGQVLPAPKLRMVCLKHSLGVCEVLSAFPPTSPNKQGRVWNTAWVEVKSCLPSPPQKPKAFWKHSLGFVKLCLPSPHSQLNKGKGGLKTQPRCLSSFVCLPTHSLKQTRACLKHQLGRGQVLSALPSPPPPTKTQGVLKTQPS